MPSFSPLTTTVDPAFRAFADRLPTGLAIFDASGACTYANPRASDLLGTGTEAWSFPDEPEEFTRELRIGARWVLARATPAGDAWLVGLEDHSAHLEREDELRVSEARFRSAFDDAVVGLCITALDGQILSVNAAMCELLGRAEEDVVARTFSELTHPDDIEIGARFIEPMVAGRIRGARFEKRYIGGDGSYVEAEVSVTLLRDASGNPQSFLTYAVDLSERKQAERAAESLMNEFLALASHELRTPLTSISGYVEMLLEGEDDGDEEVRRHFLEVIQRNERRLQRLVGDILFAAQLESGGLPLEMGRADLSALVRNAVESAAPRAADLGIEVHSDVEQVDLIAGDADRLAQAIDNLVSNALKFNRDGGRVELRLLRNDSAYVLEIEDTGVGIEPDAQRHLFDRFFRAPGAGDYAGAGLGLAITKAIVDGHGGSISVSSEPGVGTTFRVELPVTG